MSANYFERLQFELADNVDRLVAARKLLMDMENALAEMQWIAFKIFFLYPIAALIHRMIGDGQSPNADYTRSSFQSLVAAKKTAPQAIRDGKRSIATLKEEIDRLESHIEVLKFELWGE